MKRMGANLFTIHKCTNCDSEKLPGPTLELFEMFLSINRPTTVARAHSWQKLVPLGLARRSRDRAPCEELSSGTVTDHLNTRRASVGQKSGNGLVIIKSPCNKFRTAGSQASLEVGDKGKPGESRRRKATRLQRDPRRHASRAAESHYRGGRVLCVLSC